ncbi:hypothetical protein [Streptomyces poonensis]|uniref:Uncharacterized protein n=1 Tax=Streptomyces poonensis TaxID=68255 RepID=A0A918PBN1_9ACTN|nr:hypothetical protein [Streptomyces poonensis]GGY94872.1 hypothetical protein GCM10010365_12080 [Streptomyces poonensis]GLJ88739.1 hypothetical protein GCM10017589_13390 [Streptomyces poonensis]
MTDLIGRLTAWVSLLLYPRGAHRRTPHHYTHPTAPPVPTATPLPLHRSPYGLDTPLDGAAHNPVRPYLLAHEQRTPTPYRMHLAMAMEVA